MKETMYLGRGSFFLDNPENCPVSLLLCADHAICNEYSDRGG